MVGILHYPESSRHWIPAMASSSFSATERAVLLIFGAVVLCVTGVEALYADLAHFGRKPITVAWALIVFPALLLNYFGQGALALLHPHVDFDLDHSMRWSRVGE